VQGGESFLRAPGREPQKERRDTKNKQTREEKKTSGVGGRQRAFAKTFGNPTKKKGGTHKSRVGNSAVLKKQKSLRTNECKFSFYPEKGKGQATRRRVPKVHKFKGKSFVRMAEGLNVKWMGEKQAKRWAPNAAEKKGKGGGKKKNHETRPEQWVSSSRSKGADRSTMKRGMEKCRQGDQSPS